MTIRIDDPGRVHGGGARRGVVRSAITLAFAAAAALVASASGADASAPRIGGAWSSGFDDWLWTDTSPPKTLSPLAGWAEQCLIDCGPAFGTYAVRRTELMSSNAADASVNRAADSTGHMMGVSGLTVIERLASDGFTADSGLMTDWVVTGERTLDGGGTHSWSLLPPDFSPDTRWLPIQVYRFEDASLSMNFATAASASATPEASTWAMTLVGFLWLSVAGYRNNRNCRRPVHFLKGIYPR
jgi:hypothetical protein